jgi:circadian clock protein KaiB
VTRSAMFSFRLFVAGDTPNSAQALANLSSMCRKHLADCHQIEVVDVFREPARALAEGVFMTPTLVKLAPGAVLKIVGTLSKAETVVQALGLEAAA